MELQTMLPWLVFALLAGACVVGVLKCVAVAVGDQVRAHDLCVEVARLQIDRQRHIKRLERQRFGGAGDDDEIIEVDVIE